MLNLLGSLPKLAETFLTGFKFLLGDKSKRDEFRHLESKARQEAYGKEFSYAAPGRNWFDSLMDGINRIPRPLMALGSFALLFWCVIDPASFVVSMQALEHVPMPLWGLIGAVTAFYFGGRWADKAATAKLAQMAVSGKRKAATKATASKDENWKEKFFND